MLLTSFQYLNPKRSCSGFPPSMAMKVKMMKPMMRMTLPDAK